MTLSAPVVLALTLGGYVLLHVAACRLIAKIGKRAKLAAAFSSLLLCLPGLWFVLYYLHRLPEPPLLYQLHALPFTEVFLALFGFAAGLWRAVLPRALKLVPTAAGAFLLCIPFLKPVFRALDRSELHETWRDEACIQSSMTTCGPASAASILRHLGDKEVTERELATEAWTSRSGTEAWHLARAIKSRGYKVSFLAPDGLPDPKELPGILGISLGGAGHFIALLEIADSEITFVDPLRGRQRMSIDEFKRSTQIEPFFMSIQR
ncbi:cysteine peptidase family C39 domain-containing protein [Haloferula sp. BvORR071]|uniref:cysteine peptidase family C39 domain-containing protein n=1 Tax=Haloferula sp. BvORR071 TaxID=1396141 RepID=UPI0005558403|nr:cysteine peptidase family C39 domain-containing protein [Haloferula sp. BvORR071]